VPRRYCPQFDALFEKLTVKEHLQLYSRIKGLSEAEVCAHLSAARC
jgi:ATP-binding cassette subfamily A (ABC1) protein 3